MKEIQNKMTMRYDFTTTPTPSNKKKSQAIPTQSVFEDLEQMKFSLKMAQALRKTVWCHLAKLKACVRTSRHNNLSPT